MTETENTNLDLDSILNNIHFNLYNKKHNQLFKDIAHFDNTDKTKLFEYLMSYKNIYHELSVLFLKRDKDGYFINGTYDNKPLVEYFSKEKDYPMVLEILSHKNFNVSILEKKESLKIVVPFLKKNQALLVALLENKPDLTLLKNLKGFDLGEKANSLIESTYLNQTISSNKINSKTLKI